VCGIAGGFAATDAAPWSRQLDDALAKGIRHRGRDALTTWRDTQVRLLSARLAVVDTVGSTQPLTGCSERVRGVYNGEIYNYMRLRKDLLRTGHFFSTYGDGEVIVHLYEEYSEDFVRHLRGPFAVALYDEEEGRLLLARDRLGEKPLIYWTGGERLLFASDLRSLVAAGVPASLSPEALDEYFYYGFVPEPRTPLQGVRKLEPGHLLRVERSSSWTVSETVWWVPPFSPRPTANVLRAAALLRSAVGEQVCADGAVGVALSSGIDSTLLAALAAESRPECVFALSVRFSWTPSESDETTVAEQAASVLGIPHEVVPLTLDGYSSLLLEATKAMGEPIADWSAPGYLALSRACRAYGAKVLLTGHGPDELLWGYKWVRRTLQVRAGDTTLKDPYQGNAEYAEAARWAVAVYGESLRLAQSRRFARRADTGEAADSLRLDLLSGYLRSNGFAQLDALGLWNGVEVRLPYVDYRLVECFLTSPEASQLGSSEKEFLRRMAQVLLPYCTFATKRPFYPGLVGTWPVVHRLAADLVLSGRLVDQGFLKVDGLRNMLVKSTADGDGRTLALRCLVLELWLATLADASRGSVEWTGRCAS
jgi:asparagine synthase (glutamine-hydrolysing)